MKQTTWIALAIAVAGACSVGAQPNERANARAIEQLELTMTLLPEQAKDATEVTRRIELPAPAQLGSDNGQKPEELPGAEHGQGIGLETAAEARELGREFGQNVASEARENRENADRGQDPVGPPPALPGQPNDLPTPPVTPPGPPANPGRP